MWECYQRCSPWPRRLPAGSAARLMLLLLVWSNASAAQNSVAPRSQSALAEALFQEGKALLEQGNVPSACAKLSESFRVESALGTLLNLAVCHEREGKIASAWSEYTDALALAEHSNEAERAQFARQRAEELRERVPRLQLRISQPELGLRVMLDGQLLGDGTWDLAIPLDPGVHRLEATASGGKHWVTTLNMANDSGTRVLEVPRLEAEARGESHGHAPDSPRVPPPLQEPIQSVDARRTWGLVAAGVALVGLGAGTFWALRVAEKQQTVENDCDGRLCRSDAGLQADHEAHRAATWANISFGAGIAAGALSAYLLISSAHGAHRAGAYNLPKARCALGPAELSLAATPTFAGASAGVSF
jgi:tetratricopeptide (TPR) repeat protein